MHVVVFVCLFVYYGYLDAVLDFRGYTFLIQAQVGKVT